MAEDLTKYMSEVGIRVKYLHSDIDTLERAQIIRDMRLDVFDVLVGINLLREGLDIPEISLVAILDADKEGFLRSATSLIQTVGRAAEMQRDMLSCMRIPLQIPCGLLWMRQQEDVLSSRNIMKSIIYTTDDQEGS